MTSKQVPMSSVWALPLKRGSRGAASFSERRDTIYHLESIAIIDVMDFETQTIHFRDNR
uniref:hypothetical protein n=1 Tax=Candidatus Cryptobacteroides bacterium TaxID=3085639 RepID=UPI0040265FAC